MISPIGLIPDGAFSVNNPNNIITVMRLLGWFTQNKQTNK